MKANYLKNSTNVSYLMEVDFIKEFTKTLEIANLKQELKDFRKDPNPEGKTILGKNRSSIKLFIPDLMFPDENIENGEKVWAYFGPLYQSYIIY